MRATFPVTFTGLMAVIGVVEITPPLDNPYRFTYKWRLEQEHWMKSQNGGRGMSDEQVKLCVTTCFPGVVLTAALLQFHRPIHARLFLLLQRHGARLQPSIRRKGSTQVSAVEGTPSASDD